MNFRRIIFLNKILLFLAGFSLQAQTITLQGKVVDSLKQPLEYANVLAVPNADNLEVTFAITNQDGIYKLKLEQNQAYTITTSYIGFLPTVYNFQTLQKLTKLSNCGFNYNKL